jgi:hypothetical protein
MKGLIGVGFGANGGFGGEWFGMREFLGVGCMGVYTWLGLCPSQAHGFHPWLLKVNPIGVRRKIRGSYQIIMG